ncbi:MAG: peptide-methionine (S)-S-oxide reductase MsrA [Cyanobacteria bacterium P01_C01_bin.121]
MTTFGKSIVSRQLLRKLALLLSLLFLSWTVMGCMPNSSTALGETQSSQAVSVSEGLATGSAKAIFAGGCFWCMEQPFDDLPGVTDTTSGYTGGTVENPTYTQVSGGNTGHLEAMQVSYDPSQISYDQLLDTFWHNIDPLDNQGQFCDKGSQYRSAVFYDSPEQAAIAQESKVAVAEKFEQPIATDILPSSTFYPAEDYHQNYYQTRPVRYKVYRFGCGRDQRLSDLWGAEAPSHD